MVIDLHDEPFYGKTEALQAYTCRGEAHEGTTCFWRIASLYVIWRRVRLTLALTYILPQESLLSIVQRLLARRAALGFSFKVFYLDKGLCNGSVITYLQKGHLSAVIACPIRGKAGKGGTRSLCQGRQAYRTHSTFTDGTSADLAVVPTLPMIKRRASAAASGWCMSSFAWTGPPRKPNSAIVAASGLNRPIGNWAKCVLIPTRATPRCASFIWPWPCYFSMSGPICAAFVHGSLPTVPFAWIWPGSVWRVSPHFCAALLNMSLGLRCLSQSILGNTIRDSLRL
jgi:hypothetical protein